MRLNDKVAVTANIAYPDRSNEYKNNSLNPQMKMSYTSNQFTPQLTSSFTSEAPPQPTSMFSQYFQSLSKVSSYKSVPSFLLDIIGRRK